MDTLCASRVATTAPQVCRRSIPFAARELRAFAKIGETESVIHVVTGTASRLRNL
jgi:hypothetical protein